VRTSVVTTIDSFAFSAALEHRNALIEEVEGISWDARYPEWRGRYGAFYHESFGRGIAALIVAAQGSLYIGSCIASVLHEFRSVVVGTGIGYVNGLYVLPDFRDHQIGSALLVASVEWLNGRGCPLVRLHPSSDSAGFYRRLGFRPVQEFEHGNLQQ
jgi:GNAT superfamily N-acetyltransferase